MSDQLLNFDASNVKPSNGSPDPVPNGWYRAHAIESAIKPTKNNTGKYLELKWEILEGEYKGRFLWSRLNISNHNAEAQRIAQADLSAICHATGVIRLTSSAQLHHRPLMLKAIVKQDAGQEPRNEIRAYKPAEGGSVVPTAPVGVVAAAAASANAPSWAQR